MITVLIVGAGKSSSYLIEALLRKTKKLNNKWKVIIADSDESLLVYKIRNYPAAEIAVLDINNEKERRALVKNATIVVSLMPPSLHILLAKDCLDFKKNLITSSYASDEIKAMNEPVKSAGLTFMCEMGLDPGIDHMSASHIFDSVQRVGADIVSFKSYCGGLISPDSDDNPWHYKFSWNPMNIVNAGKDGARYLRDGNEVNVSYKQMFAHTHLIDCEGVGKLAYYPNRDSLSYIDVFKLNGAKEFMRATLRHPTFVKGWNALIRLGVTNTSDEFVEEMTSNSWMKKVIGYDDTSKSVQQFAWEKYDISSPAIQNMIEWLDLFSEEKIVHGYKSSGEILLEILSEKWKMKPSDKDMVVMQHEVNYKHKNWDNLLVSSMVVIGENSEFSAMAKTVGMPMAILTELMMENKIDFPKGVVIPTMSEVYRPVLNKLRTLGVVFNETITNNVVEIN